MGTVVTLFNSCGHIWPHNLQVLLIVGQVLTYLINEIIEWVQTNKIRKKLGDSLNTKRNNDYVIEAIICI